MMNFYAISSNPKMLQRNYEAWHIEPSSAQLLTTQNRQRVCKFPLPLNLEIKFCMFPSRKTSIQTSPQVFTVKLSAASRQHHSACKSRFAQLPSPPTSAIYSVKTNCTRQYALFRLGGCFCCKLLFSSMRLALAVLPIVPLALIYFHFHWSIGLNRAEEEKHLSSWSQLVGRYNRVTTIAPPGCLPSRHQ